MPNNPEFQLGVLRALLGLFSRPSGPVIEDYDIDVPEGTAQGEESAWACVLPLPPLDEAKDPVESLKQALSLEVSSLLPWYQESLSVSGRTTFGLSGLTADSILVIADYLGDIAAGNDVEVPDALADYVEGGLRYLVDDVKAYYMEAAKEQPGAVPPGGARMWQWFYHETYMGSALYDIRDRFAAEHTRQSRESGIEPSPVAPPFNPIPRTYSRRPLEEA